MSQYLPDLLHFFKIFDLRHLMRFCNPEEMSYDDDLTTPGDENLKKVTFQMKDQLDFLIERLNDEVLCLTEKKIQKNLINF